MSALKKAVDSYSKFIVKHPYIVIFAVIILMIFSFSQMGKIKNKSMEYKDMLPEGYEVIKAFDKINDDFGGSDSIMIAIEVDPQIINSNEPRDILDPKIIQYLDTLTQTVEHTDDVESVRSASTVLRDIHGGVLPKDKATITQDTQNTALFSQYVNEKKTILLVQIILREGYSEDEIVNDLQKTMNEIPKPAGISVSLAGDVATGPIVNQMIGPDMGKTSMISLFGIILILFVLLRSVIYTALPLTTIGSGIILTFGFIGLMQMEMSSATSGVMSMIMGIGIDFGIQIVIRYRQELESKDPEESMVNTLNYAIIPMATTTLAALIGFKAMSMGQLTFLAEMGVMMSYGITACFIAAITLVPALIVVTEQARRKIHDKLTEKGIQMPKIRNVFKKEKSPSKKGREQYDNTRKKK